MTDRLRRRTMIPIDEPLKEFEKHLKSHPRTFLSARFGDGKSFFLAAAEKKFKSRWKFLKIYPVNYQVAENQDIFEYIKRDLLFQMYGAGMVPDSYEIPDGIASYFFLLNNKDDFYEAILKGLSCFDATGSIKAVTGAAKFIKSIKAKYDKFKENGGGIGEILDDFIVSFDQRGIYEADPITLILCDIIADWKKRHPRRKLCLVFEDMDRIDPYHIFRILNVISAHMDYSYKNGVSPQSSNLVGNKFGVDNIVVCLDYDNLGHIFHHFYGKDACFEGYINKFCDKGIFRYSLHEQARQYYIDELIRVTGMESKAVMAITDQFDVASYTLRQFYHAVDGVGQQISLPSWNSSLPPHRGLYLMAAILRRLGLNTDEIVTMLSKAFHSNAMDIGPYMVTSMLLRRGSNEQKFSFSFGEKDDGYLVRYLVNDIHHDGRVYLKRILFGSWDRTEQFCKPEEEVGYVIRFVNK